MTSTRLPGKVMQEINGKPMISWQISRILKSNVDGLVLVTSTEESDNTLSEYVNSLGVPVYRG
jgi:spore coat polysaccharide biosynthesis protein SpsF